MATDGINAAHLVTLFRSIRQKEIANAKTGKTGAEVDKDMTKWIAKQIEAMVKDEEKRGFLD